MAKNDFKAKIINFFSYSCIITFILLVIVAVGAIFVFRKLYKAPLEAAVLNAVQIKVFNYIYGKVAIFLNDKENHETENLYNNNLALKLFLFKFVNSYSGLFYLAFVQQPYEGTCSAKGCLYDLGYQLCIIFATNMSLNIMELGLPYLTMKWNERSENKKIEKEMKEEAAKSAEESSQTVCIRVSIRRLHGNGQSIRLRSLIRVIICSGATFGSYRNYHRNPCGRLKTLPFDQKARPSQIRKYWSLETNHSYHRLCRSYHNHWNHCIHFRSVQRISK